MCGFIRLLGLAAFLVSGAVAAQVDSVQDIRLGQDTGVTTTLPERLAYQGRTARLIDSWRSRVANTAALAATGGSKAEVEASARLTAAWERVDEDWRAVQEADDTEWTAFKQKLDTALGELEQVWQVRGGAPEASAPRTASDDEDKPDFYAIDVATRMLT